MPIINALAAEIHETGMDRDNTQTGLPLKISPELPESESKTDHTRMRAARAQNYLIDPRVARDIVSIAKIDESDTVYDLGAGTGMITTELLRQHAHVVAVEQDPNLVRKLHERFGEQKLRILEKDMRRTAFSAPYKVVANLPFNLTADIMKRLLYREPTPVTAHLVVQREAAMKYAGQPHETAVSLLAKPWFDLSIVRTFKRSDFVPAPNVEAALLQAKKRVVPILQPAEKSMWHAFIRYGFGRSKSTLKLAFKPVFTHLQWKRLANDIGFVPNSRPSDLSLDQWVRLFRFFVDNVTAEKKANVLNSAKNFSNSSGKPPSSKFHQDSIAATEVTPRARDTVIAKLRERQRIDTGHATQTWPGAPRPGRRRRGANRGGPHV